MSLTKKYQRKPYNLEAVQVTQNNIHDVAIWCGGDVNEDSKASDPTDVRYTLSVPNIEGAQFASLTDVVVRNEKGRFEVIPASTFFGEYEEEGLRGGPILDQYAAGNRIEIDVPNPHPLTPHYVPRGMDAFLRGGR